MSMLKYVRMFFITVSDNMYPSMAEDQCCIECFQKKVMENPTSNGLNK